jgi:hypothetical protein
MEKRMYPSRPQTGQGFLEPSPAFNGAPVEYSSALRIWLWLSIVGAFVVVHTPKDLIVALSGDITSFLLTTSQIGQRLSGDEFTANLTILQTVIRLKGIVFLISLLILSYPVMRSLRGAHILWERNKLLARLLRSAAVFGVLSVLIIPLPLGILHRHYSEMSISPFDAPRGWFYRRLLMPAVAHYLGFEGPVFYYVFSVIITFVLIFLVSCSIEHQNVRIRFCHLLSISTSAFIIFNFMTVGWADSMMDIVILLLLFVADSNEARLSLLALGLATHEATVFIFVPMILFLFPRKRWIEYFAVIALYFSLHLLSFQFDAFTLIKSQVAPDNRTGLDWLILYPWRGFAGWLLCYKLLWLVIGFGIYKMLKDKDTRCALAVVTFSVIVPAVINVMTVDVYRHVAEGFCGLLIAYVYLARSGYLEKLPFKCIMALNILMPSIYVGTNSGFRFKQGLYFWLCNLLGLQGWLAKW